MCVLCDKYTDGTEIIMETETCFAIREKYAVNFGHTLVLPKACKATYFDMSYKELEDMDILLRNCKRQLDLQISPDGYNIGFNIGRWAGQEIEHCVAHLIPRFAGDVPATELLGGIKNFKEHMRGKKENE